MGCQHLCWGISTSIGVPAVTLGCQHQRWGASSDAMVTRCLPPSPARPRAMFSLFPYNKLSSSLPGRPLAAQCPCWCCAAGAPGRLRELQSASPSSLPPSIPLGQVRRSPAQRLGALWLGDRGRAMRGAQFPLPVGRRGKIFSSRAPTPPCLALSQVCRQGKAPSCQLGSVCCVLGPASESLTHSLHLTCGGTWKGC